VNKHNGAVKARRTRKKKPAQTRRNSPARNIRQQVQLTPAQILRQRMDTRFLTRGRLVVIGLGGIGLWLVRGAVTFLAGLFQNPQEPQKLELLLCDGDAFKPENTYRMDIPDCGFGNKAAVVGHELLERLRSPNLVVRWRTEYVSEENVADLIRDNDCVLLACDNHKTRSIVGRHCADGKLENVVLISGGNDGVEGGLRGTYGNVQVYLRAAGQHLTAPLFQFHPEIAEPADKTPDEVGCLEQAVGAPQLAVVNLAVASAMCNALLRLMMPVEGERMYDEIALDVLEAVNQPHWVSGPQEAAPSASAPAARAPAA
jgi:hypothetical protein